MTIPTVSTGEDILASWANQVASDVNGLISNLAGQITLWHGTLASIPSGWVLCDGNNGTPNLLDRFPLGVPDGSTNPGTTGGATSKTTDGHVHNMPARDVRSGYGTSSSDLGLYGALNLIAYSAYHTQDKVVGGPNKSYAGTPARDTDSETDTITDIRPKFYTLAFIMKT